jgi:ADP-heptose:LPS heptosyltransferase
MKPHALVVRLDNEGDVLLAGPAVRAVAAGSRRVTMLCGRRGRAAAELLPGVDEVIEFTAPWIDPEPEPVRRGELERLIAEVQARTVDVAVVFTSFHQSPLPTALALRLAGVPRIAAISVDYPGSLLDVRHVVEDSLHEVERGVSLAEAAGFPLPPGDDMRLAVKPVPVERGEPYVVVHPGASAPARTWSPEGFRDLVAALLARGTSVRVTGAPGERGLTEYVAADSGAVDLGGATTFAELAGVLAGASAVVVGNTGPAHLAAAVGTPVVSIYAPTVPAVRWRPWGVPHVLLGDQDIACAGCRVRVCPFDGQPCLAVVRVSDVLEAIDVVASRQLQEVSRSADSVNHFSAAMRGRAR